MLNFQVSSADVAPSGGYSLDGQVFDFSGTARLQAYTRSAPRIGRNFHR